MGIIDNVSLNLSTKLGNKLNKSDEEKAVLNYGLFVILHTLSGFMLILLSGIITDMILEILLIFITSAWFKRYTGGAHASTPEGCLVISVILSLVVSKISIYITNNININIIMTIGIFILIFSYYLIYNKCPVPSKNKPLNNENIRNKLRKKALRLINLYTILIIILYIIYDILNIYVIKNIIVCFFMGIVLQMSVVTKVGVKFINLLNHSFNILNLKSLDFKLIN